MALWKHRAAGSRPPPGERLGPPGHGRLAAGRGVSLVEVLVAVAVLAVLVLTIYSTVVSSIRGISMDRLGEAQRHLSQDLLERFCHPYTDVAGLFPEPAANVQAPLVSTRTLTVDEAIAIAVVPQAHVSTLKAVLEAGKVSGFTLSWTRGLKLGAGDPARAMRMDKLWCFPVVAGDCAGPQVGAFRMFYVRGS
ncbi:MAG: prepilin-type N-terminal cleavage/methylation domain-containing protein [Candidatus Riflebacteria bacterium]|nr:prepilin-type N-terminal cleavage/methylation domain-containing protein [Candidatus Riflebacteria bacterium]